MIRRLRFLPTVLALTVAVALLPASTVGAATGAPLRPAVSGLADPSPNVVLRGSGWGHSVGMSQYGAYAMARAGRSHDQILKHYYPGTTTRTENAGEVTVRLANGTFSTTTVTAVGGAVPWTMGAMTASQPKGATWTVNRRLINDAWWLEVLDHSGARLQTTQLKVTVQLPEASGTSRPGTYIQAYNPNGSGSLLCDPARKSKKHCYGYGRTEFTLELPSGATTPNLVMRQRLSMESYLRGLGEVPAGWGGASGGQEALEAQAIIARTYALASGRNVCATPRCQVFIGLVKEIEGSGGNWVAAVRDPAGKVMRYGDKYAQTFYSSSHGGRTEASEDSWAFGGAKVDYLTSVDDPWSLDVANPLRSWTGVATNYQFRRVAGAGLSRVERVQIVDRTAGGSPRTLRVTGPEGTRDFTGGTGTCNRAGHAANALRCDLDASIYNAAGAAFAGGGRRPPSTQIHSIGFAPFTDDDGSTHEYATVWANQAGIAFGTTPTTFKPGSGVTRAQMAAFIYRTFDIPTRTTESFTDVNGGDHAEAIASVTAAGIAHGYDSRRFGPNHPVTREQMASFIARAMGLSAVRPSFSDVDPNSTHGGNIGAIAAQGVTSGCGGDRYCPKETVTRGQMTAFLHRVARSLR